MIPRPTNIRSDPAKNAAGSRDAAGAGRSRRPGLWLAAAAVVIHLAAGCMYPGRNDAARVGPFFVPINHVEAADLTGIKRVMLLPVWTGTVAQRETAADLDETLATALLRQNRFEVVVLSREECRTRFQAEALPSTGALPSGFLDRLRREFAVDAVLFVDLTAFSAYRPLAIGFRAKLATGEEPRLIWAFDQVFASDEPTVVNSARHHFLGFDHAGVPADPTVSVLQSPSRFGAYAASAMFATLPPVRRPSVMAVPPPPPVKAR